MVWWFKSQRLIREKAALQILNKRNKAAANLAEFNRVWAFNRYQKWKARELISRQNINNLQQHLFTLRNMAEARREPIFTALAPILGKIEQYTGQEPSNDYLDKVIQAMLFLEPNMTALENANNGDFDDAVKFSILSSKLAGKYISVPANNPYNGNANINSPAILRAWMNLKYQRETIGSQQVAYQKLTQEKFLPSDSPDTYEKRICPLLLGIADNDACVLGFLKSHLSGDLFT